MEQPFALTILVNSEADDDAAGARRRGGADPHYETTIGRLEDSYR
jgi:hypothetical protein